METHRTILVLNLACVDATTMEMLEDALDCYLAEAPRSAKLPVDFGDVKSVTSGIGVLSFALRPESQHYLVCMRVTPRVMDIFKLFGWADCREFEFVGEGTCPACKGAFDHEAHRCASCGPFDLHPVAREKP